MKIKELRVRNFRSLRNVIIRFDEKITCLVGENDAGKTSILDCIRVFSENAPYAVEVSDFSEGTDEIEMTLELSDGTKLYKKYKKENSNNPERKTYLRKSNLEEKFNSLKVSLDTYKEQQLLELEKKDKVLWNNLLELASKVGERPRSNYKIKTVLLKLEQKLNTESNEIEIPTSFPIEVYYLDGKQIESIDNTIENFYFRDFKREIWNQTIKIYSEDEEENAKIVTIKDIIQMKVEVFIENLENVLEEVRNEIKYFLPDLEKIDIEHEFQEPSLNFKLKTKLIDSNDEKVIATKRGDGTKRRVTMALVKLKLKKKINEDAVNIFIFDEPDTHLHVKAQRELIKTLQEYSENKQIIITTHSPFIINSFKPSQIRFLGLCSEEGRKVTKIFSTHEKDKEIEELLQSLGLDNLLLFFARKILIVEGETEENFIKGAYNKFYGRSLYSDFIKMIRSDSDTRVPLLIDVYIKHFGFDKQNIFIMVDSDIENRQEDDPTYQTWKKLKGKIPEGNIFLIGEKEFEDAFSCEVIYEAWKQYVKNQGSKAPSEWTLENIKKLKEECKNNPKRKFSDELGSLNKGYKRHPIRFKKNRNFVKALLNYLSNNQGKLPERLKTLLEKLKEE